MIPAGKFITVRANQPLSSDHNQVGDFFTVTLADPVVIDGVVVAQRGQTLSGRVTEVAKGGHFGSTSRLAIQLTELTLVDGQQVPIQTQLAGRKGPSTTGRDAAIIAGTAGMGAAIGAASTWDWDKGAGIGAGIGAAVGLVGALVSPGAPAVVYPETLLSFRIEQAVGVDTSRSPQSFQQVNPAEYSYSQGPAPPQQPGIQTGPPPGPPAAAPYPYPYPYPYPAPYPYPYTAYAYPYPAWGFGVVVAPGYYYHGGHYYYHGGYYGHHH
jgi:hypothetical protein